MSQLSSIQITNSEGVDVPSLSINFNDLRTKMETFRAKFDDYLNINKEKVIESRNEFNITMSKNKDGEKSLLSELESLNLKEVEISRERTKQQEELEETKQAINDYTLKKEQMSKTQKEVEKQISELRQSITRIKEEQSRIKQTIVEESNKNAPELILWETTLGLTIEGISDDVIKFTFVNIDDRDIDKEFSCTVDLSERDYRVIDTKPKLDDDVVDGLIKELNRSRKPSLFLRDLRREFKKVI